MKKIILLVLSVFFLLLPVKSLCDEKEFSIRNNISFGMSLEEIMERESAPIKRIGDKNNFIEYYPVSISGIKNCLIDYSLLDGSLYHVYIDLCDNNTNHLTVSREYDKLNTTLCEKYGAPLGNRDGITSIYTSYFLDSLVENIKLQNIYSQFDYKYDEWLFVTADEKAVIKIDHTYEMTKNTKGTKRVSHILFYQFFKLNEFADDI